MDPLSSAVAGISAQSVAFDQISANIANSQTIGYKRSDTSFADLVVGSGPDAALGGVTAWTSSATSQQGTISKSSVPTAMAIQGDGFFVVQDTVAPGSSPQTVYTRRGDFAPDRNGYLVNGAGQYLEGLPVNPSTGQASGSTPQLIQVSGSMPAQNGKAAGTLTNVSVTDGGLVQATYDNGQTVAVAQVPLASFNSEDNLQRLDGGTFAATPDSGAALIGASGRILGGSVENSNTDITSEFSKLIATQQAYSASAQIVSITEQMTQDTLKLVA